MPPDKEIDFTDPATKPRRQHTIATCPKCGLRAEKSRPGTYGVTYVHQMIEREVILFGDAPAKFYSVRKFCTVK